jgi:hypothetical protein
MIQTLVFGMNLHGQEIARFDAGCVVEKCCVGRRKMLSKGKSLVYLYLQKSLVLAYLALKILSIPSKRTRCGLIEESEYPVDKLNRWEDVIDENEMDLLTIIFDSKTLSLTICSN